MPPATFCPVGLHSLEGVNISVLLALSDVPLDQITTVEGKLMDEGRKLRVAIGVFDDLVKLHCALTEFRSAGLDAGQVALLADTGALSGQLEEGFSSGNNGGIPKAAKLIIRGRASYADDADTPASPTGAVLLTHDQMAHFEDWITSRLSNDLNDHLAQGACILIVPIATVSQEQKISQILLNHSTSLVQLHDVALPN